jgi:putative oligomerization/nucleic acid binding protein
MPYIPSRGYAALIPHPLVEGLNPTIGWLLWPRAKGGSSFVIIRRTAFGTFKAVQSFPLSEDGWVSAWQAFSAQSPAGILQALATLKARETYMAKLSSPGSSEMQQSDRHPFVTLHNVAFLGGYLPGVAIVAGKRYDVPFLEDRLLIAPWHQYQVLVEVPYSEVEDVEIGGPGIVRTGGGFFGGGFGARGAIEGMAIATVLNGLTSRTSIKTVVRIQAKRCELFLLDTSATPERLRIALSYPLGAIRAARATDGTGDLQRRVSTEAISTVDELSKLAEMLEKGLLTREEFNLMKAKLTGLQP